MGPSTESLALADYLISKLGLQVDRISLAYAIMDHVEVEYADELAQPSPAGQGDERLAARIWGIAGLVEVARPHEAIELRDIADALAARQPVGEPVEFDYPEFHQEGMGCGLEDRGITDRYEAMRYGFDEALDQMAAILDSIGPLYAAPPAQAVDLGQFIALAKFGEEFAFSAEKQPHSRVVYSQASRLLALIDSKAVGK